MLKRMIFNAVLLLATCNVAAADIVADAGAGPGTGIAVASGSTVSVSIFYLPGMTGVTPFDGVGLDLNWDTTGFGSASPTGPDLLAGGATGGMGFMVEDLLTPTMVVVPGTPLTNPLLPPAGGAAANLGGGGHFDPLGGALTGGMSYGFPSGSTALDLMGADFVVTGSPGDTITFTPSGILPSAGTSISAGAFTPVAGGAHYFSVLIPGIGFGITGTETAIGGVTVTIVPEPAVATLTGVFLLCIAVRRRRG